MNQPSFPAANRPSRPLMTLSMTIAMPLIVVAANVFGVASARAEELRTPSTEYTQRYGDAVHALGTQRYSAAYGRFAALADEGHAPSALMALAMVTYRPSMSAPPNGRSHQRNCSAGASSPPLTCTREPV